MSYKIIRHSHLDKPEVPRDLTGKSPKAKNFEGDILFDSSGRTFVIDSEAPNYNEHEENPSDSPIREKEDPSSEPICAMQFVTFLKTAENSSNFQHQATVMNENDDIISCLGDVEAKLKNKVTSQLNSCGVPVVRSFRVHVLSGGSAGAMAEHNYENKILAESENKSRPILMCFPCRLTFGASDIFMTHAFDKHLIVASDKEKSLLDSNNVSSVIQKIANSGYVLCFLEPVVRSRPTLSDINNDVIASNKEVEVSSPVKEGASEQGDESVSVKKSPKEDQLKDDIFSKDSINNATANMSNSEVSLPPSTTANNKPTSLATSSALDLTSPVERNTNKATSPPEVMPAIASPQRPKGNILNPTQTYKGFDSTAGKHKDENKMKSTNSPKYLANGPDIGKEMSDLVMYGGVSNLDPVFHMSMFQTRNSCKTLKCPKCNWHYKYRQTLEAHMKEKHQDDTSDCGYCKGNQPHPRLSRGESYACGYKPFKCEVCNYSTTTKGNLSIHMQSDKHLYNTKSMQHHQANGGNPPSPMSAHLLASRQEQLQNYHHQMTQASKRSASSLGDSATPKRLSGSPPSEGGSGVPEHDAMETSSDQNGDKKSAMWRCDVCKYETNIARNLRIHMTSEKHAHNVSMSAREEMLKRAGYKSDMFPRKLPQQEDSDSTTNMQANNNSLTSDDHQNPPSAAISAMYNYYLLASMQMANGGTGNVPDVQEMMRKLQQEQQKAEEHEKLAQQQQQLAMAQQYMQFMAHMNENDRKTSPNSSIVMQQLLIQQQLNLWRQIFPQQGNDSAQTHPQTSTSPDTAIKMSESNPPPVCRTHLFSCSICGVFPCNDYDSLSNHMKAPRLRSSRIQAMEQEWITRSPDSGYVCGLCNYSTQLKTNFSLHCKTEKHTAKLSLISHIREGGPTNEWKIKYAVEGNNMQQVTCNGCQHTAPNLDRLRTHNSTERHDGTVAMCRYLDTLLKPEQVNSIGKNCMKKIFCKPCNFKTTFVVEMVQHMQNQDHVAAVDKHKTLLENKSFNLHEIIMISQDNEDEEADKKSNESKQINNTDHDDIQQSNFNTENDQPQCIYCNDSFKDEKCLLVHVMTQHNTQLSNQCQHCKSFFGDTMELKLHIIKNHPEKHFEEFPDKNQTTDMGGDNKENVEHTNNNVSELNQESSNTIPDKVEQNSIPDVKENVEQSQQEVEHKKETDGSKDQFHCPHCGENLEDSDKYQLHLELHRIKASAKASGDHTSQSAISCTACQLSFKFPAELYKHLEEKHHTKDISSDHLLQTVAPNRQKAIDRSDENLLTDVKANPDLISRILEDTKFRDMVEKSVEPLVCPLCSVPCDKADYFMHIKSHDTHPENSDGKMDVDETSGKISHDKKSIESDDNAVSKNDDSLATYKINFSAICPVNGKQRKSLYPENRSRSNRDKARKWKEGEEKIEESTNPKVNFSSNDACKQESEKHEKLTSQDSSNQSVQNDKDSFPCLKCGKEFSTVLVLKVHEKVNHDNDLSCDEVAEFAKGYSEWFWKSTKEEDSKSGIKNSEIEKLMTKKSEESVQNSTNKLTESKDYQSTTNDSNDGKSFQQMAVETLIKNYGVDMNKASQSMPTPTMNNFQQQLMMLLLSQQQMGANDNMANLMQMMHGGGMQLPGQNFPSSMAEMLASMGGQAQHMMMPYQWLALVAQQQQQQQMQQMLMYPALASQALPFFQNSNMPDETRQQLLAMLASGQSMGAPGSASLNPALAAALQQMYQGAQSGSNNPLDKDKSSKTLNARSNFPPPLIPNHQVSSGASKPQNSEMSLKRPRTRITDDQLKILRSHFDINTSPGDEQIAEMAMRTGLPSKVIKHWFRNTLFKERQRNKDSPYNFNIPPITSLDDANHEGQDYSAGSRKDRQEKAMSPKITQQGFNGQSEVYGNMDSDYETTENSNPERSSQHKFPDQMQQSLFNKALSLMPNIGKETSQMESSNDNNSRESDNSYNFDTNLTSYANSMVHPASFNFSDSSLHEYSTLGSNKRTPRTRFSDFQLKILQEFFDRNAYPKDDDLDKLSQVLDLSTRVIVVWFQNARQKARKNYEMQQQGVKRTNSSKSFSGSMGAKITEFAQHASPNSKSPVDFAGINRSQPTSPEPIAQKNAEKKILESTPSSESLGHARRFSENAENLNSLQCKMCEAKLPSMHAYQQHLQMHAAMSPYLSNILQRYGMIPPRPAYQDNVPTQEQFEKQTDKRAQVSPQSVFPGVENTAFIKSMIKPDPDYTIMDKTNREAGNVVRSMLVTPPTASSIDNSIRCKRKISVSPTHSGSSSSSALSPLSARSQPTNRDGQQQRDPKRLRTTITPEQLQFLYQQYMVDSSPSRKVIEHISDIVGLTKRVVQVWFQNTRARERKGQFRSVGRITSTLGQPHPCPHCDQTLRNKADLDAHIRESHNNLSTLPNTSSTQVHSAPVSWPEKSPVPPLNINPSVFPTLSTLQAYKDKSERNLEELKRKMSSSSSNHENGSMKQQRLDSQLDSTKNFEDNSKLSVTTANNPSSFINSNVINNSANEYSKLSSTNSPEHFSPTNSAGSSPQQSPTQGLPGKRYRTQMSSDQVRSLKHFFNDFKMPSLAECEALGKVISLPKRVIQVWFQNARAKEKKAKPHLNNLTENSDSNVPLKSHCDICPNVRYSSTQEVRDHIFSQQHMARFKELNLCDSGNISEDSYSYDTQRTPDPFDNESSTTKQGIGFANNNNNSQTDANIANRHADNNDNMSSYASIFAGKPEMFKQFAMQQIMARSMGSSADNGSEINAQQQMENYKTWMQQVLSSQSQAMKNIEHYKVTTDANNNAATN